MADACFLENGSSYISVINWDMSTKFGLLIDFDLLKAAISKNAKPEIVFLRFGRHIALSRWRPRPLNTISGFAFVDIDACRRSRSLWANQTCRHISTDGWYITTCFFAKQTFAILEIYFRFRFRPFPEICTLFCIKLPNFVQIEAPTAEMWIWRHVHFSRWRPRRLNTTSGFVSVDVAAFRRSKYISKPNFVEISQMTAEI